MSLIASCDAFARHWLRALLLAVMVAQVGPVAAETARFPDDLVLNKQGAGEFRRFGFLVYEAQLWVGADPSTPPLALQLTYKREIPGKAIVDASVSEMRELGADEGALEKWRSTMARIFPDVRPGDRITGIYHDGAATFLYNDRMIGRVEDADFARLFFGIWLDPRTSAPRLRDQLLGQGQG